MEDKDVKLSDFSIQLGLAVDRYIESAINRIVFLETKIIEYYKKTNSEEYREFFQINVEEPKEPKEEQIPAKSTISEKKPKMRVVK
jgi:hypothetical protein